MSSITSRRVWALTWPAIVSNLSVPLLGAVDTAVMGHQPDPAFLGAVALGAVAFDFVYWGFGFLRMGTTGFAAQARGAGGHSARVVLGRPLLVGAGIGVLLWVLAIPIEGVAFQLLGGSPEVSEGARAYFRARILGAPAVLMGYAVVGWLFGMQRPRSVLALQVVANGSNVVLDLAFVYGLGMTVEGVGYASAAAQWLALGAGVIAVRRVLRAEGAGGGWGGLWDPAAIRRMFVVNADLFVRTVCLIGAFAWFTARGARFGEVVLAANAVLINLHGFTSYGLDGFAHAAEALVGERHGAGDRVGLRRAVSLTTAFGVGVALVYTLVWWGAGGLVVDALTDLDAVRAAAREFLPWVTAAPLVSVWCFMFDGVFIGATRTRPMRNGMLLALAVYLGTAWLAIPAWANHGLWAALTVFFVARAVFVLPSLRALLSPAALTPPEGPAGG